VINSSSSFGSVIESSLLLNLVASVKILDSEKLIDSLINCFEVTNFLKLFTFSFSSNLNLLAIFFTIVLFLTFSMNALITSEDLFKTAFIPINYFCN
jgi:hypothetical protein